MSGSSREKWSQEKSVFNVKYYRHQKTQALKSDNRRPSWISEKAVSVGGFLEKADHKGQSGPRESEDWL